MRASFKLVHSIRTELDGAFSGAVGGRVILPEHELMIAILDDAVNCYIRCLKARDLAGRTVFEEANDWIFEEHDDWMFSFTNICQTLSLDPNYIRKGLRALSLRAGVNPVPRFLCEMPHPESHRDCPECAAKRHVVAPHAGYRPDAVRPSFG